VSITSIQNASIGLLVLLMFGLVSSSALAQELSFEDAIGQAKTAYDAGDYDKAVELLIVANRIQPNSRLLLNIARSYVRAGDCAKGVAYFRAFERADDAEDSLVAGAIKEAAALKCEEYDSKASGRVMVNSVPPGAKVTMGGKVLGTTPFEVVSLPRGPQTFLFELEGYEPLERSANLDPESDARVAASLQEAVVVEEPVEPEPIRPVAQKDYTQHYIAGGIAGVGAGLLIMGIVYDLVLIPGTDEERKKYQPGSADYQRLTDDRSSQSTVALIGYVGGGVLFAGGVGWLTYLLLTDNEPEDVSSKIGVLPTAGPQGTGISVFGTF